MRLFLFLSALLAALTGSAASARAVVPQQVEASCARPQVAAHVRIAAVGARPIAGRARDRAEATVFALPRGIPLYQDRLRE